MDPKWWCSDTWWQKFGNQNSLVNFRKQNKGTVITSVKKWPLFWWQWPKSLLPYLFKTLLSTFHPAEWVTAVNCDERKRKQVIPDLSLARFRRREISQRLGSLPWHFCLAFQLNGKLIEDPSALQSQNTVTTEMPNWEKCIWRFEAVDSRPL